MSFRINTDRKFLNKETIKRTDNINCVKKVMSYLALNKGIAVGIAANQLFMNNRVFGINYNGKIMVFVNPEIIAHEGNQDSTEGCMSIKNGTKHYHVKRPMSITIKDEVNGEQTFHEYYATVIAHEFDHLEGLLISNTGVK